MIRSELNNRAPLHSSPEDRFIKSNSVEMAVEKQFRIRVSERGNAENEQEVQAIFATLMTNIVLGLLHLRAGAENSIGMTRR